MDPSRPSVPKDSKFSPSVIAKFVDSKATPPPKHPRSAQISTPSTQRTNIAFKHLPPKEPLTRKTSNNNISIPATSKNADSQSNDSVEEDENSIKTLRYNHSLMSYFYRGFLRDNNSFPRKEIFADYEKIVGIPQSHPHVKPYLLQFNTLKELETWISSIFDLESKFKWDTYSYRSRRNDKPEGEIGELSKIDIMLNQMGDKLNDRNFGYEEFSFKTEFDPYKLKNLSMSHTLDRVQSLIKEKESAASQKEKLAKQKKEFLTEGLAAEPKEPIQDSIGDDDSSPKFSYMLKIVFTLTHKFRLPYNSFRFNYEAVFQLNDIKSIKDAFSFLEDFGTDYPVAKFYIARVAIKTVKIVSKTLEKKYNNIDYIYEKGAEFLGGSINANTLSMLSEEDECFSYLKFEDLTKQISENYKEISVKHLKSLNRIDQEAMLINNYLYRDSSRRINWVPMYRLVERNFEAEEREQQVPDKESRVNFNVHKKFTHQLDNLKAAWFIRNKNFAFKRHYMRISPDVRHFNVNTFWQQHIYEPVSKQIQKLIFRKDSYDFFELKFYLKHKHEINVARSAGTNFTQRTSRRRVKTRVPMHFTKKQVKEFEDNARKKDEEKAREERQCDSFILTRPEILKIVNILFKNAIEQFYPHFQKWMNTDVHLLNNSTDLEKLCRLYENSYDVEVFYYSVEWQESERDVWGGMCEHFLKYLKNKAQQNQAQNKLPPLGIFVNYLAHEDNPSVSSKPFFRKCYNFESRGVKSVDEIKAYLDVSKSTLDCTNQHRLTVDDISLLEKPNMYQCLNLSNNMVIILTNFTFTKLVSTQLIDINLSHNYIIGLSRFAFSYFPNLLKVNLGWNLITELRPYERLEQLVHLNLSHNQISELAHNTFSSLPRLTYLDLSYNCLKDQLPRGLFEFNKDLRVLNFGYNMLTQVRTYNFSSLENLENITLHNNSISEIDFFSFYECYKLRVLILNDNKLNQLNVPTFIFKDNISRATRYKLNVFLFNNASLVVPNAIKDNLQLRLFLTLDSERIFETPVLDVFKNNLEPFDFNSIFKKTSNTDF